MFDILFFNLSTIYNNFAFVKCNHYIYYKTFTIIIKNGKAELLIIAKKNDSLKNF